MQIGIQFDEGSIEEAVQFQRVSQYAERGRLKSIRKIFLIDIQTQTDHAALPFVADVVLDQNARYFPVI